MAESKSTRPNQSGDKMLRIIEMMAQAGEALRVLDIAKALDLPSSTVLRYLLTLRKNGYVDQEPQSSRYYLTLKLCNIAAQISTRIDPRRIARPYLKSLSQLFGESACLAVERERMVCYIEVVESPDSILRSMQRIGSIAPMHCTGIGKLFLSEASAEELERLIAVKGLPGYTRNTLTRREDLLPELERIRARGYAFDQEECEIGARCVAFPIRDYTGKIVAGISITGPSTRLSDAFINARLDSLRQAAAEISQKLGYTG